VRPWPLLERRGLMPWSLRGLVLSLIVLVNAPALAVVEINETKEYYDIEGTTVAALQRQMLAKGPPHTGGARALAVTKTKIRPTYKYERKGDYCRIIQVNTFADITIVYPEWVNAHEAKKDVQYRWDRILAEIVDHEDQHVRYAIDIAYEIDNEMEQLTDTLQCDVLKERAQEIFDRNERELRRLNQDFHEEEERKRNRR
jgi:predicted secreted Zn-dependent protease